MTNLPPHVFDHIVHKALASNMRRGVLLSLIKGEKYLSEIASEINRKPQTVDFHLNVLSEIGLVDSKWKEGKKFYFIKDKKIIDFLKNHKAIPAGFKHKPPHEIVMDAMESINKRLDKIEKKLDQLNK
jgi:predicted transcriptional regulator